MSKPFIVIPGLEPIDDPAAEAWLERADELALAYSREVHGEEPASHSLDIMVIHLAASVLWRISKGKPCWSMLDPHVLNSELADVPAWQFMGPGAFVTIHAFFCFLAKHGHLSRDAALRAQNRFVPLVRPQVEQLLSAFTGHRRPRTALPTLLN